MTGLLKTYRDFLISGILVGTCAAHGSERSPVAAGLSLGMGLPWIIHAKPEIIARPLKDKPSFSAFLELNSIFIVTEISYGVSLNFENGNGYMNSVYVGSGDDIIPDYDEEGTEEWRKQFMVGWELKKEFGLNFGYFLNSGVNVILGPTKVFPKANGGLFFIPGF